MSLDDRCLALERRTHRLERALAMLFAGFLVLLVWKFVPGDPVVDGRSFVMRDDAGVIRATLAMWENRPTLRLNDADGKARAMLFLHPQRGGVFRLTDPSGHNRLVLELSEEGMPSILLANEEGRSQTVLTLTGPERNGLVVLDPSRRTVFATPLE